MIATRLSSRWRATTPSHAPRSRGAARLTAAPASAIGATVVDRRVATRGCRSRRTSPAPRSRRRAAISAVTRPSWRTRIRSDIARTSGRSLEMRMIPRPDAASSEMIRWTSTLAPMSMPRVGSSRISRRRLRGQPLGEDDLLLVAARQRADHLLDAGHLDVELLGVVVGDRPLRRRVDEEPREEPRQDRQRHVLGDREVEHEALLVAVLGQVGDARVHRRRRAREARPRLPSSRTSPASRWSMPNSTRATSVRPAPTSPAKPDDLAGADREADVAEDADPGQPVDLEQDVADRRLDLREERHGPADHVPDEVGRGQLGSSAS